MDWVPPGVSVDLAAEYMKKLPSAKVPICGSAGALYRRQQFERQLPVHDLAPGLCHQLTPHEIDELNKYLSNIKTDVVGQGKVEKFSIITHHPSVYSTPLNNQSDENIVQDLKKPYQFDVKNANSIPKPFVPYAGTQTPSNTNASPAGLSLKDPIHLKTPSSFLNNNKFVKNLHSNINRGVDDAPLIEGKDNASLSNNNDESRSIETSNESAGQQPNSDFLLPPYKGTQAAVRSPAKYLQHSEVQRAAESYCVPRPLHQLKPNQLNQFNNLKIDDAVCSPVAISDGDNLVPTSDLNIEQHIKLNCHTCHVEIVEGEVVVSAERAGNAVYWHPQCFVCATCKELLVDLVYFYYKDDVYCGRHYAEKVSMLRCFACDELIFVKEYTMAEGKQFHIRHFCCFHCDTPLAGKEYIPMDNHPVCLDCYRTKFSKVCQTCENIIEPVDKRVTIKDLHWHAVDACFCCQFCKKPLANSKMVIDSKKPFCNKQCALSK
ncbi:testin isoform X2 [Nilaparvata lugens]|nr:testin isoform X2 [Nilaparvata lugens]